jgi:hypothetical protein
MYGREQQITRRTDGTITYRPGYSQSIVNQNCYHDFQQFRPPVPSIRLISYFSSSIFASISTTILRFHHLAIDVSFG